MLKICTVDDCDKQVVSGFLGSGEAMLFRTWFC